jgi:NAD(P)-dependent dehydrogenase (short-subunit alcohol dehydrogenase family)
MQELNGRVAVITGAASGIGLAMARRFAAEGMKLVLADIEEARLADALAQIRALGVDAISQRVDVASEDQVNALADAAYARFGRVHLVCNNAGVAAPSLMTTAWQAPISDWQWMLNVNLMGVLYGVRAFVPRMLAGGEEGHVVNTASVAGLLTAANPYHVSKQGVTCITEGLYRDLRRMGAKVSASVLCPGIIRTDIMKAERNRPSEFGPATNRAQLPDAVQQSVDAFDDALQAGWDPSAVADAVAQAVLSDRFYVVPAQDALLDLVRTRMQDIIEQRNPTRPTARPWTARSGSDLT